MFKEKQIKLLTLLSLYTAQAIPMSFFTTVVPVIMRQQHYSLEAIGLMQLLKLPWVLKFLWAPLIDRTGSSTGGYKKWIFYSEGFYALTIAVIAFFSPEHHFFIIITMMIVAITASATQDIATDAWAILTLKKEERSLGNSMQSMGSFIGAMAGSGFLLVIYYYLGWTWLLQGLALMVVLALLPLYFYRPVEVVRKRPNSKSVSMKDLVSFFRQQSLWPHLAVLALFHSSLVGIMTMIKPLMIDLGYNARDIGIIAGIFGTGFGALSAMIAGIVMRKINRKKSAMLFALINLIPVLFFLMLHPYAEKLAVILLGVALLWGAYAMGMVLLFTVAMDNVRHCREGTDFTLQIVVLHLGSLILAVASGKIADTFTYGGLFIFSMMLGLINLGVVYHRFFRLPFTLDDRNNF